jgi:8-oxo-dGTP diphosphatase
VVLTCQSVLVVAAIIVEQRRVLVTQRMIGTHLAGAWEFPGGKVEVDEDPRDALVRELREELGIEVVVDAVVDVAFHRYPTKSVLILFFAARRKPDSPPPSALEVAALQWRASTELADEDFPAADARILGSVRALLGGST